MHFCKQKAYAWHAPARRRFPRRRIYAKGIDQFWEADLTFVRKLNKVNDGVEYLLCVIDVFSKKLFVRPMKTKGALTCSKAFEDILLMNPTRRPANLRTDQGTEFLNKIFEKLMAKYGINHFVTLEQDIKSGVVERVNRTIKLIMYRYMSGNNTQRYLPKLPELVEQYNRRKHRSIGMAPNDVNEGTADEVYGNLYVKKKRPARVIKFSKGEKVRLLEDKGHFYKGYTPNFTQDAFVIREVRNTTPVTYRVDNLLGKTLKRSYYNQELLPYD